MTLRFNILLLRLTYWQCRCWYRVFPNILKDCDAFNYAVKQSKKNCLTLDREGNTNLKFWNPSPNDTMNDMNLHSVLCNSQSGVFMWYSHPFSFIFLQVLSMDLRFCVSSLDACIVLNTSSSKQLCRKLVRILNLHKLLHNYDLQCECLFVNKWTCYAPCVL
jgi:hypothetical protein